MNQREGEQTAFEREVQDVMSKLAGASPISKDGKG